MERLETPRNQIKGMLRTLFLRSRERSNALKEQQYTCQKCGVKQSKAKGKEQKVHVHHKGGINNWNNIIDLIKEELLNEENLVVLCPDCHKWVHREEIEVFEVKEYEFA